MLAKIRLNKVIFKIKLVDGGGGDSNLAGLKERCDKASQLKRILHVLILIAALKHKNNMMGILTIYRFHTINELRSTFLLIYHSLLFQNQIVMLEFTPERQQMLIFC